MPVAPVDVGMGAPSGSIVAIPADGVQLEGILEVPAGATGIVVFAHGSGSSRTRP